MADDDRTTAADLADLVRKVRLVAFDFDGVFTDNTVIVDQDGRESVRAYRGDGIGLRKLDRLGIANVIISSEVNPVVTARADKMATRCLQGVEDKVAALQSVLDETGLTMSQAAFVGNDVNDLQCLEAVGLPIVVQDAHPDVVRFARYRTAAPGGLGAVREVCDLFARVLGGPGP